MTDEEILNNVKSKEDLLAKTLEVIRDRSITSKAYADLVKRANESFGVDKATFKSFAKLKEGKGKAWVSDDPLTLDKEADRKDSTSQAFVRLAQLVETVEAFGKSYSEEFFKEYFEALQDKGITITIDHSLYSDSVPETLSETDENEGTITEALSSAVSYIKTIDEFSDTIRKEHSAKSEELNFSPADTYSKVVTLYRKAKKGQEVDDDLQEVEAHYLAYSTALNEVAKYAQSPTSPDA